LGPFEEPVDGAAVYQRWEHTHSPPEVIAYRRKA
jgi:hypothetical protein